MLLELERIDKRFGSKKALQEVSFQVAEGEVVALAGKNGAGLHDRGLGEGSDWHKPTDSSRFSAKIRAPGATSGTSAGCRKDRLSPPPTESPN